MLPCRTVDAARPVGVADLDNDDDAVAEFRLMLISAAIAPFGGMCLVISRVQTAERERLTFRLDLQRYYGFGLTMTIRCYHRVGAGKVQFGTRYFQTVCGSVADASELWSIPIVFRLRAERKRKVQSMDNKLH